MRAQLSLAKFSSDSNRSCLQTGQHVCVANQRAIDSHLKICPQCRMRQITSPSSNSSRAIGHRTSEFSVSSYSISSVALPICSSVSVPYSGFNWFRNNTRASASTRLFRRVLLLSRLVGVLRRVDAGGGGEDAAFIRMTFAILRL